jgi:hypothetical protein
MELTGKFTSVKQGVKVQLLSGANAQRRKGEEMQNTINIPSSTLNN